MTDYSELVKALRGIEKTMFLLGTSPINMDRVSMSLAYDNKWGRTAADAADAIEELQAELKELCDKKREFKRACGLIVDETMQMPKLGEWELIDGAEPMRWGCSKCKYLSWETSSYCPRCGAKMEVQE